MATRLEKVASPEVVRAGIKKYADRPTPVEFSEKRKGPILGAIAQALKDGGVPKDEIDQCRYLVMGYLVNPLDEPLRKWSSKELTPQQWNGFSHWNSEWNGVGYEQRLTFPDEVLWVLYRAKQDYARCQGQITFGELVDTWKIPDTEDWYSPDLFYRTLFKGVAIQTRGDTPKDPLNPQWAEQGQVLPPT